MAERNFNRIEKEDPIKKSIETTGNMTPPEKSPKTPANSSPTVRTADGYAKKTSDCGDVVEFFIALKQGVVHNVEFTINGCSHTLACAQAAALLARGRNISDARKNARPESIMEALELTPEQEHCAAFVYDVLLASLIDCLKTENESWRKLYRTQK